MSKIKVFYDAVRCNPYSSIQFYRMLSPDQVDNLLLMDIADTHTATENYYLYFHMYDALYHSHFDNFCDELAKCNYDVNQVPAWNAIMNMRGIMALTDVHIRDIKSGKCKVIIDTVLEGFFLTAWRFIHHIFDSEPSSIIWLTGDYKLAYKNDIGYDLRTINYWERHMSEQNQSGDEMREFLKEISTPPNPNGTRLHYCTYYNRRIRNHRVDMMIEMFHREQTKNMIWSWGGNVEKYAMHIRSPRYRNYIINKFGNEYINAASDVLAWGNRQSHPSTTDNLSVNLCQIYNFDHIRNTYYQFVVETFASDGIHTFLSEKTFKAFLFRQPFVMWGDPNTVSELRKSGYKTFDHWINHSYDTIENPDDRRQAIADEIVRLNSIPKHEWTSMLIEMQEELNHNYHHLVDTAHNRYSLKLE
jgi:hypothetical protein